MPAILVPLLLSGQKAIVSTADKVELIRRAILREFEGWVRADFVIVGKADSEIAGAHGNRERFFALKKRSN